MPGGRYLRALYETEAPANRQERLFEEMQDFGDLLRDEPVMLEDLIRVSDRPLPDREPSAGSPPSRAGCFSASPRPRSSQSCSPRSCSPFSGW